MTPEKIKSSIEKELITKPNFFNSHNLDLKKCLIEPIQQKYIDSFDNSKTLNYWTVLIESQDGYRIAYDPENDCYGLGIITNKDELMHIGNYGTFIETVEGM